MKKMISEMDNLFSRKKSKLLAEKIIQQAGDTMKKDPLIFPENHFSIALTLFVEHFAVENTKFNKTERSAYRRLKKLMMNKQLDIVLLRQSIHQIILRIAPKFGGWLNVFNSKRGFFADTLYAIFCYPNFSIEYIYYIKQKEKTNREQVLLSLLKLQDEQDKKVNDKKNGNQDQINEFMEKNRSSMQQMDFTLENLKTRLEEKSANQNADTISQPISH